jgi:hypothetical protein
MDAFSEIDRACSALRSLYCPPNRDDWWPILGDAIAEGVPKGDCRSWCETGENFDAGAFTSTYRSLLNRPITGSGSLFKRALDGGWTYTDGQNARTARPTPKPDKPPRQKEAQKHALNPVPIWEKCVPATDSHEYITRKLGMPDGLRVYSGNLEVGGMKCDGALVVPITTLSGELVSLQFIGKEKRFLSGCPLPPDACFILWGPIVPGGPVYELESIGNAWTAQQATGAPSVCCFGSGRMAGVAAAIHALHPTSRACLVADAGKEVQCSEIAKTVNGTWVGMPAGSPSNFDINDYHVAHRDLSLVRKLLEGARGAQDAQHRYKLLSPSQILDLPPIRWLVRSVLPAEGIGALYGASGSGKSFLALDMLAAVARGGDWFGCRTKPVPVLYLGLEGEAGIGQRLNAHQKKNGALPGNFRVMLQSLDIRLAADRADLVLAARAAGCTGGVCCIDTLNRAAPGADENDSAAMGAIIGAAKALQAALGGLVLLIHHTGKDASKGLRGHSSLHAALDVAIEVSREGDRRAWKLSKSKDGADADAHSFALEIVDVGTDEDGEAITSCVVAPEENQGEAVRSVRIPSGSNARVIWPALKTLLRENGERRPDGVSAELPLGRPVVSLDAALDKAQALLTCDADQRRCRARTAITSLVSSGFLTCLEGWLWIP